TAGDVRCLPEHPAQDAGAPRRGRSLRRSTQVDPSFWRDILKIAIIGLGEVGRCYAKALHAAGYELSLCDARPSTLAADLAAGWRLPVQTSLGAWLSTCDWILSCVTGSHALGVVEQCAAQARPGATLCDMTTASPDVKRLAAERA